MPRKFTQKHPSTAWLKRARRDLPRPQTEAAVLLPPSERNITQNPGRGLIIGRRCLGEIVAAPTDLQNALQSVSAQFYPEGASLRYVATGTLSKYAANVLIDRKPIDDAINGLGASRHIPLSVTREAIDIVKTGAKSNRVEAYDVVAFPIRVLDVDASETTVHIKEKRMIEGKLGIPSPISGPKLWLGYLSVPIGEATQQEMSIIFDECIADRLQVGSLEAFRRK